MNKMMTAALHIYIILEVSLARTICPHHVFRREDNKNNMHTNVHTCTIYTYTSMYTLLIYRFRRK